MSPAPRLGLIMLVALALAGSAAAAPKKKGKAKAKAKTAVEQPTPEPAVPPAAPPADSPTPPETAAPPSDSGAPPPPQEVEMSAAQVAQQARTEFKAGQRHAELGHFDEAILAFERAYKLKPLPGILFNIGQCHNYLKNYEKAVYFFETYLRQEPNAPDRAVVQRELDAARQKLAIVQLAAASPVVVSAQPAGEKPAPTSPTTVAAVQVSATETEPVAKSATAEVAPSGVEATSDGRGLSVAAKLGGTLPTSALGLTYFAGLELGYRLPLFDRLLGVAFEVAAGQPAKSGNLDSTAAGGSVAYRLSQRMLTLAFEANGQYAFGNLFVLGGMGYGVYLLKASVKTLGMTNTESQTRAGIQLRGGAGVRLGPGDLIVELRYHYVDLAFSTTGRSNAGGVTLGAGYRLSF
jgi:tetratricopeptide (TPR) repeat protein